MNVRSTQTADNSANADFHGLIARLLLFGESEVVNAAAQLTKHDSLSSEEAKRDFGAVVMEMRKSLLTGHDMPVIKSAMTLAGAKSWPDPKGSLMRNV